MGYWSFKETFTLSHKQKENKTNFDYAFWPLQQTTLENTVAEGKIAHIMSHPSLFHNVFNLNSTLDHLFIVSYNSFDYFHKLFQADVFYVGKWLILDHVA